MSAHPEKLRDRHEQITRRLAEEPSAEQRAELKQDIVALFREAEAAASAAVAFKESVKQLALRWKDGDARVQHSAVRSTRVDHLGASTFVEKGWSRLSLWDFAGAEQSLLRALELQPDDEDSETMLGWALMLQEKYEDAQITLKRVLNRNQNHWLARANLGYIALRKKNYGDAIEQLSVVTRSSTDSRATLYANLYLGMVYRERGMYDDAESFFERTLLLGPNMLQAWYELGRTHWYAGRRDAASVAWRRGADANRFNPWGKRCAETITVVEQGGFPPKAG